MAGKPLIYTLLLVASSTIFVVLLVENRLSTFHDERNNGDAEGMKEEISRLKEQLNYMQQQLHQYKNMQKFPETQLQSSEAGGKKFPPVRYRNEQERKRVLITGGAGFVGSHLVDHLMADGHEVIALDNFYTGRRRNVERWIGHPNFELVHHDMVNPYYSEVDRIYHLASPASPPHYMANPVKTLKINTIGTINVLGLARRVKARLLLASTSEVYGDPEVTPQEESYVGHVNPIGPRSCYDEGKRAAEALVVAYSKQERVDARIARIFNTFGPRMHMNDGRVVSNFVLQALKGEALTIYGNGNQTRSFQYVSDLVEGLITLMESNSTNSTLPVNLGNPEELTIYEFANLIQTLVGSKNPVINLPEVVDDPQRRRPDIRRAAELLGWRPRVKMQDGLRETIDYFRAEIRSEKRKSGRKDSTDNEQK